MYGVVPFYSECLEQEIKPIIGCEVYVARQSRHVKDRTNRSGYHLTLLAQNNAGYQNLVQMVSKSHLEGFYQTPRVDRELLELHADGICCLSGCMSGELAELIARPDADLRPAVDTANWYAATFPDRYFLEIQRHRKVENIDSFNHNLLRLAEATGLPLVATNDSHYTTPDQHRHQDTYFAIHTDSLVGRPRQDAHGRPLVLSQVRRRDGPAVSRPPGSRRQHRPHRPGLHRHTGLQYQKDARLPNPGQTHR